MQSPDRIKKASILGVGIALMFGLTTYVCLQAYDALSFAPAPPQPIVITPPKPFQFPGGNETLSQNFRFVALYGSPQTKALGVLGHQSPAKSAERVQALAKSYQAHSSKTIYPTFEIITTIASAGAEKDKSYSRKTNPEKLLPLIDAARQNDIYVVLDLQPGRDSFLKQAKLYEELLRQPHVGLALDPEWRLKPDQVHLEQIGRVSAKEINQTSQWLSQLTHRHSLPEKLLLIHQFQLASITNIQNIEPRSNLLTILQMDGQGSQPDKNGTYSALTNQQNLPNHIRLGWKNFYKEDSPTLSPAATMQLTPKPWYISYQ